MAVAVLEMFNFLIFFKLSSKEMQASPGFVSVLLNVVVILFFFFIF